MKNLSPEFLFKHLDDVRYPAKDLKPTVQSLEAPSDVRVGFAPVGMP